MWLANLPDVQLFPKQRLHLFLILPLFAWDLPKTFSSSSLRVSLIPGLFPAWLLCPTPAPSSLQSNIWVEALSLKVRLVTPVLHGPAGKGFSGQINLDVTLVRWNPSGTRRPAEVTLVLICLVLSPEWLVPEPFLS